MGNNGHEELYRPMSMGPGEMIKISNSMLGDAEQDNEPSSPTRHVSGETHWTHLIFLSVLSADPGRHLDFRDGEK